MFVCFGAAGILRGRFGAAACTCLFCLNSALHEIIILSVFLNLFSLSLDIYLACTWSYGLTMMNLFYLEALVPHHRVHGCNNNKKIMVVRIIKHTMEIIHLTDANSILITVDAIIHRYFSRFPLFSPAFVMWVCVRWLVLLDLASWMHGCGSRMVFLLRCDHTYAVVNNLTCHSPSLHIALLF